MPTYRQIIFALFLGFLTTMSCAETQALAKFSYAAKQYHDVSKAKHYTINIKYPFFNNIPTEDTLNALIKRNVDQTIADFKSDMEMSAAEPILDLPIKEDSNTLDTNFKIYNQTKNIISIRFDNYKYYYGAAHPNTDFKVLNYDLKQNKLLTLNNLFKANTNYLQVLAEFSRKSLTDKFAKLDANNPVELQEAGLAPEFENYQVWNITPEGLLITFPAYQVAAYVFGPQEVLIPYESLNNILRDDFIKR